jgi:hypothetical protein
MTNLIRLLIRETLLSETPLMDVIPYKGGEPEEGIFPFKTSPTVGYKLPSKLKGTEKEKRKQFADAAKVLLADSEDNWYIVVLKHAVIQGKGLNISKNVINSPDFKSWINSLRIPKGSKIIVPVTPNYEGDYLAPEWQIVHDIIGHTINSAYWDNTKEFRSGLEQVYDFWSRIDSSIVWEELPQEFKISGRNPEDRDPDIFAAIFANKFDKRAAAGALDEHLRFTNRENPKNILGADIVDCLVEIVERWKKIIPYDTPTPISPFS